MQRVLSCFALLACYSLLVCLSDGQGLGPTQTGVASFYGGPQVLKSFMTLDWSILSPCSIHAVNIALILFNA